MSGVEQSIGFVLHSRRLRENSRILEVLTRDHGRLALVARLSPRPGRGDAAQLQPFRELLLRWRGQRELKNLHGVEPLALWRLDGEAGICGLYCSELLLRLLPPQMPLETVFGLYRATIAALEQAETFGPVLRRFEWGLLEALGYAADTGEDCVRGEPLATAPVYYFLPGQGFSTEAAGCDAIELDALTMQALQRRDFDAPALQRALRDVLGAALRPLLGEKPLHSRALMRQLRQMKRTGESG